LHQLREYSLLFILISRIRPYLTHSPTSYVKPTLKQVNYYDSLSQQLVNITVDWIRSECQTNIESYSKSYPSSCQFDTIGYSPSTNHSLVICRNAIQSIEYIITHSQSKHSSLDRVDVYLTLQDVVVDNSTSTPSVLTQSYSLRWTDIPSLSSLSNSSGNMVKRFIDSVFDKI
jgi:hypothetical protein